MTGQRRRERHRTSRPPAALLLLLLPLTPWLGACSTLSSDLPEEPPPLVGMEEPAALRGEPDDEASRTALALGGFTGIHVMDGRRTLAAMDDDPDGVLVRRVVENSPGDAAGVAEGDLIFEIEGASGDATGERIPLAWPSEWRQTELDAAPGSVLRVYFDRAGVEGEAAITVAPRVRPAERDAVERFRDEKRVGVVLRTATEVEARAAGLGPGGGAVVVGLTRESPWRAEGLRFGDVVARIDGAAVAHPQVVLDAIRDAAKGAVLELVYYRDGAERSASAPVSRREQTVRAVTVPPLFSYESDRGETETSILLGFLRHRTTRAAWEWRLLWLFSVSGGDADALEEVEW